MGVCLYWAVRAAGAPLFGLPASTRRRFVCVRRVPAIMKQISKTKNKQTIPSKERMIFEAPPLRGCCVTSFVCENGERKRKPEGAGTARGCVPLCAAG